MKVSSHLPAASPRKTGESRQSLFDKYMPQIMQCRLDDLVQETPLQLMPALSERLGVRVLLTR